MHAAPKSWTIAIAALVVGCGGELHATSTGGANAAASSPTMVSPKPPPLATLPAQVELREPGAAMVGGQRIAFDGMSEALAWPALTKALARKQGDASPVVIQVARDVPIADLLRAAWTFRASPVRVQSLDDKGVLVAIELPTRASRATVGASQCHLAVFVMPSGALRIATPAGAQEVGGDHPAESLARALEDARAKCPIGYVAFGAETNDVPWGRIFDVIVAVDRAKSAGDARYVLGEAMHTAPTPATSASGKLGN
jgi:hypothetical protein